LSAQIRVGEESSGELTKTGDQLPSMAAGNLGFAGTVGGKEGGWVRETGGVGSHRRPAAAAAVDGRESRAQAVGSAPCPASRGSRVGWELFFFYGKQG